VLASPDLYQAMAKQAPESIVARLAASTVGHYDKMFEFVHNKAGGDA